MVNIKFPSKLPDLNTEIMEIFLSSYALCIIPKYAYTYSNSRQ
jgi:hypothetical protein